MSGAVDLMMQPARNSLGCNACYFIDHQQEIKATVHIHLSEFPPTQWLDKWTITRDTDLMSSKCHTSQYDQNTGTPPPRHPIPITAQIAHETGFWAAIMDDEAHAEFLAEEAIRQQINRKVEQLLNQRP